MPPCLDIYVATADRSTACLERFLAHYADLSTDRLRQDYEVFVTDVGDTVATGSLSATLVYGLADPNRNFALYFTSQQPLYTHVMVYFGHQGRLLLGLSVEDETAAGKSNQALAEAVMDRLCAEYHTEMGVYGFELAPADAEERLYPLLQ
ncbi:hypothetical protein [Hymenobacter canadensis]|uniref:TPM domain-containing protein n=1 Tax=Hymenobacter canadensis TaxID=2999067 RepID=A0ABY7LV06_9BACT|nr:hypothetical protein [Hymenobacter canadensis]WBA44225.1 hypothetical protein O3303_20265 [Hymenobacter canadensis]